MQPIGTLESWCTSSALLNEDYSLKPGERLTGPSLLSAAPTHLEVEPADDIQGAQRDRSAGRRNSISMDDPSIASTKLRVLMVEDNAADVELMLLTLRNDGFEVSGDVVQTDEEFTARIRTSSYDVILADYNLPKWRGMEALDILRSENLEVPLIVVTGYLGEEKAVECIKQGATDCVLKDRLGRLPSSVRKGFGGKTPSGPTPQV